jgi:hypothetical protein
MWTQKVTWFGCLALSVFILLPGCTKGTDPLSAPPVVNLTVMSPNGGETFSQSDSLTIRWDMSDSVDALMSQMVFSLSLDSGITFNYLGDIRKTSPAWKAKSIRFYLGDSLWDDKLLQWKAIVPSRGCIISINQYNSTTLYDQSDNPFRITAH